MAKNRPSNASQAPPASAKKAPATSAAAKPVVAASNKKQQQASAKKEDQPLAKKAKVEAPVESESEDEEELSTLMAADEEDSEDDSQQEGEDDELSQFFEVPEYVYETTYVSFQLPPQGNVTVMSQPGAVVTLKSATLGYEVKTGSRSVLIASVSNAKGDADECNEDEEEHDHDNEDEDDIENLVLGTMLPNVCENLALDVTFAGDFMLNNVSDVNPMYIVAVIDPTEDDDDEEIDSEDDDEGAFLDADADSDSEEDEDKQVVNKLFEAPKPAAAPAAAKPAAAPAAAAAKPAAAQPVDKKTQHKEAKKEAKKDVAITNKPTVNDVVDFVISELKQNKGTVKQTDMGTGISKKFGTGVKQMGFEEKTLSKLLEVHAKGKVNVTADAFKLPK